MGESWEQIWGSEWPWVVKIGSAIADPEEKKVFWENIKARKMADRSFSIYELYPRTKNAVARAREECMAEVKKLFWPAPKDKGDEK